MAKSFPRNGWYQAAWSGEVRPGEMLSRRLLDTPVLIVRDQSGAASAMLDRCPHRFAPLSRGTYDGNRVVCGYHGLAFDNGGTCIDNPHGPIIERSAVPTFPLVERFGRLWIWPGEPESADRGLIPDLTSIYALPPEARAQSKLPVKANWMLLVDNLLDTSHSDYLHPKFGDFVSKAAMSVEDTGDGIRAQWHAKNVDNAPIYRLNNQDDKVDIWLQSHWLAPALVVISTGAAPLDVPLDWKLWSIHALTPETEISTHYFFEFARDFDVNNSALTAELAAIGENVFRDEDVPMLEAQQEMIGTQDLFALEPLVLRGDRPAVQARGKLRKALTREMANA